MFLIKLTFICSFLVCCFFVNSQAPLPDNFKIGDYIEVFGKDSVKIYFNCTGTVADKNCATYYRVGKMDTAIINVTGNFHDYDISGRLIFKATMQNNNLEGHAEYFYGNGKLREVGSFKENNRHGRWTFYYPNGKVEKVYDYIDNEVLVLEAYSFYGKATVVNGTGSFKTEFSHYKQCDRFEASGQLLQGKKIGKWIFKNPDAILPISIEMYDNGKFINGNSMGREYADIPKISLRNFYANENLIILDNSLICTKGNHWPAKYQNQNIHYSFYPALQQNIAQYKDSIKNQWLIVGIAISKNNKITEVNIASSINDIKFETYIYDLLIKMTNWQTVQVNSSNVKSDIFFTVLIDNNQIIIPTNYLFHYKEE